MAFVAPISNNDDQVKVADLNGHLLIIEAFEFTPNLTTVNGQTDVIDAVVIDLDTGFTHQSFRFFNVVIVRSLKTLIGQKCLTRIGQGAAKPGKSAPWILVDATGDATAVAKANAFIANAGAPAPAVAPAVAPAPANINDPAVQALLAQLGAKPF